MCCYFSSYNNTYSQLIQKSHTNNTFKFIYKKPTSSFITLLVYFWVIRLMVSVSSSRKAMHFCALLLSQVYTKRSLMEIKVPSSSFSYRVIFSITLRILTYYSDYSYYSDYFFTQGYNLLHYDHYGWPDFYPMWQSQSLSWSKSGNIHFSVW